MDRLFVSLYTHELQTFRNGTLFVAHPVDDMHRCHECMNKYW